MSELTAADFDEVLASDEPCYLIELLQAAGSTPRDAGAMMIVGRDKIYGTIGGGSAEWVAIKAARSFIEGAKYVERQTIKLGPEIDQCCGGSLDISYHLVDESIRGKFNRLEKVQPPIEVLIFGAGHTGLALADALVPLGMNIRIIDTRPEYATRTEKHKMHNLALPEEAVREAKPGAVYVITTHDHSLDFIITAEALARGDAVYVGMIGSPTKRAVLKSWLGDNNYDAASIENLHCPIGGTLVKNKQPEVIAAMSVAEILLAIQNQTT